MTTESEIIGSQDVWDFMIFESENLYYNIYGFIDMIINTEFLIAFSSSILAISIILFYIIRQIRYKAIRSYSIPLSIILAVTIFFKFVGYSSEMRAEASLELKSKLTKVDNKTRHGIN